MALLFFDGFETYGSSATMADGLNDVYDMHDSGATSGVSITSSSRITNGQAMRINLGVASEVPAKGPQLPLSALSSEDDWVVGAAFRLPAGSPYGSSELRPLFEFLDSDSDRMITLRLAANGTLSVARYNAVGAATVLGTAASAFSGSDWNYVEMKVKFHVSTGGYTVRVGESIVMSGGPVNTSETQATRPSHLRFGHLTNVSLDIDDLYILDDTGSINNDFLGDIRVQRLRPNDVGASTQFTASAAVANWTLVNELSEDDDSTYVQSATAGQRDLYNYENLPTSPGTIYGVIAKPVLRKSDAGSRTYKLQCLSGPTLGESGTRYPANSYVRQAYVFQTDPRTGALWTHGGVDAAQFGLEIVS